MSTVTVYGLSSSEDDKIRYVGQTTRELKQRLIHHLYDAKTLNKIHKSNWIKKVLNDGYKINIFIIEENAIWAESEIKWIKYYRDEGIDLVNTTDGGEGVVGYVRDDAWRKRKSEQMKGKPSPRKGVKLSDETKAKISAAQIGKEITSETKAKISAALKGRNKSPEHIAKVVAANKGKKRGPLSEEHKDKLSIALTGRVMSQESIAKGVKTRKGFKHSQATKDLWSKQRKGKLHSEAQKQKISEGLKKAYKNGRANGMAKFTDDEVREIRKLLDEGLTGKALSKKYNVSQSVISEIKRRVSYNHIK